MSKKFNRFSIGLGLLDYVNPIFYTLTMLTILKNREMAMARPYGSIFLIGAVISILFGFIIPTGKVIVGLGLIRFVMPVALIFAVNTGILISGLMLLKHVFSLSLAGLLIILALIISLLVLSYARSRKLNTVAVLTGAAGYLLLYVSLICLALQKGLILTVILYGLAIVLFVMLCGIGIKANLKDPRIHWVIEISNVICQGLVALATVLSLGR